MSPGKKKKTPIPIEIEGRLPGRALSGCDHMAAVTSLLELVCGLGLEFYFILMHIAPIPVLSFA